MRRPHSKLSEPERDGQDGEQATRRGYEIDSERTTK